MAVMELYRQKCSSNLHNLFPKKIAEAWKGFYRDMQTLRGRESTWDILAVEFLQGQILL